MNYSDTNQNLMPVITKYIMCPWILLIECDHGYHWLRYPTSLVSYTTLIKVDQHKTKTNITKSLAFSTNQCAYY